MRIIKDILQGSDEWHALRSLKLTGSNATAIAANGKGLDTYINKLILEKITGVKNDLSFSFDVKRGNELEPLARTKYEFENDVEVQEVAFIVSDCGRYGVSPDGLIGDDGGIEIKARNDEKHLALLEGGKIESGTLNQIQMCLLVSGRAWWDFVSYNPNFKKHSLHVQRVYPDQVYFNKLRIGLRTAIIKLDAKLNSPIIQKILNNAA